MIFGIVKSLYPYFLPLVIYGIFLRLREKKWSRAETFLFLLFASHSMLVLLQIIYAGGDISRRYFLTGIPLMFGWAGYALRDLAGHRMVRRLIPVCLLLLFFDALRPSLEYLWKRNSQEELFVIRKLSPVIRQDWQGKCAFYKPEIRQTEYCSPQRPLVQCERYPFLGYASGGSCVFPGCADAPLPDYRIFENTPVVSPYLEIHRAYYLNKIYRIGKRIK